MVNKWDVRGSIGVHLNGVEKGDNGLNGEQIYNIYEKEKEPLRKAVFQRNASTLHNLYTKVSDTSYRSKR